MISSSFSHHNWAVLASASVGPGILSPWELQACKKLAFSIRPSQPTQCRINGIRTICGSNDNHLGTFFFSYVFLYILPILSICVHTIANATTTSTTSTTSTIRHVNKWPLPSGPSHGPPTTPETINDERGLETRRILIPRTATDHYDHHFDCKNKNKPKQCQMCHLGPRYVFSLVFRIFSTLTNIFYFIWVVFMLEIDKEGSHGWRGQKWPQKTPDSALFRP